MQAFQLYLAMYTPIMQKSDRIEMRAMTVLVHPAPWARSDACSQSAELENCEKKHYMQAYVGCFRSEVDLLRLLVYVRWTGNEVCHVVPFHANLQCCSPCTDVQKRIKTEAGDQRSILWQWYLCLSRYLLMSTVFLMLRQKMPWSTCGITVLDRLAAMPS